MAVYDKCSMHSPSISNCVIIESTKQPKRLRVPVLSHGHKRLPSPATHRPVKFRGYPHRHRGRRSRHKLTNECLAECNSPHVSFYAVQILFSSLLFSLFLKLYSHLFIYLGRLWTIWALYISHRPRYLKAPWRHRHHLRAPILLR